MLRHKEFDVAEMSLSSYSVSMSKEPRPPVHMDLVTLDSTVIVEGQSLIEDGFLTALRDPAVRAAAEKFGNPVELLETAI